MAKSAEVGAPGRLVSLDAYRGFVMLAMASAGLSLGEVARHRPGSPVWAFLARQTEHAAWGGCTFWDLIQPSFMFIVGVALPFSYAARAARGDARATQFRHALVRSAVLVALGVFLASAWAKQTNFAFTNVLAQIGLGYPLVFLALGRPRREQLGLALAILAGYWAWFALEPVEAAASAAGASPDGALPGFLAHWSKNANAATAFDRWFLNLFPRAKGEPFFASEGGYATLNFVPSAATMLFGVVAGGLLRDPIPAGAKVRRLLAAGALGLAAGVALDETVCPVVKRIWTPSWAVFSAGWTCGLLAVFYGVIDGLGYRRWAFPLVVVGVNSIAFYLMAQLMKPWVASQLKIHLGPSIFDGSYGPMVRSASVLLVFWLIAYGMYRQRIFVRI